MTRKELFKYAGIVVVGLFLFVGAFIAIVITEGMPSLEQLENPPQDVATRILSSDGELIDYYYIKRRSIVPFDSIPKAFISGLIAVEDKKFYDHWGVHSYRFLGSMLRLVTGPRQGGSTITMQLARNLYFSMEQTMTRKVREMVTAVQIERTYTKKEILEMYSNTVLFGRGAYGIRMAAQLNFDKSPKDLTISECAYLIGVLKNPSGYDAREDYERAIQRRNLVLRIMSEDEVISPAQHAQALSEPIKLKTSRLFSKSIAPHFVEWIRQQLGREPRLAGHDLYRDGLTIYTTLNAHVQRSANLAVEQHLRAYQRAFSSTWTWTDKQRILNVVLTQAAQRRPEFLSADVNSKPAILKSLLRNASFVDSVKRYETTIQCGVNVIDPATGAILAMVGASPQAMESDPASRYGLNHATQIERQPGSSFKPFIYAKALQNGLRPETDVDASPFSMRLSSGEVWSPSSSTSFLGMVPLRTALKFSINSVAARLITEVTSPSQVASLARSMGISSNLRPVPALALGAAEVKPIEITAAYGVFANQGIYTEPVAILRVEDRLGNIIYENRLASNIKDILSPGVASQMVSMMRGVVDGGTASAIRQWFKGDAAGKTGTTNDYADAWFIGYTPNLLAGIWVGFDDKRVTFSGRFGEGGKAAAPIWGRMMANIYADPNSGFKQKRFGGEIDSSNILTPEVMLNPPSERADPTSDSPPNPISPTSVNDPLKHEEDRTHPKSILPPLIPR